MTHTTEHIQTKQLAPKKKNIVRTISTLTSDTIEIESKTDLQFYLLNSYFMCVASEDKQLTFS